MKAQGISTVALAAFVFGMSMFVSANAATDVCKRCELNYEFCLSSGGVDPAYCFSSYLGCLSYGDGQRPCPAPR